ncbi:MAG: FkbM family methyltransferase [Defluviitaleaceae bacterium]|nr:FkbM family methyltransferase [Defluviitaleaceae bacterium]
MSNLDALKERAEINPYLQPPSGFFKRMVRKLAFWSARPAFDKQTMFNNAVADALKHHVGELENIQNISNEHLGKLQAKIDRLDELEFNLFSEKEENIFDTDTYSQSGEDKIVSFLIKSIVGNMYDVTYLDLGANHAKMGSNTYLFYKRGARGVLVEANPALIPELKFYRNGDIILNNCVSDKNGDKVKFYVMGTGLFGGYGLSTADKATADEIVAKNPDMKITEVLDIETVSVNSIIDFYLGKAPVLVSLDIEGLEMQILQSIDFEKYRPLIFIIETVPYTFPYKICEKNAEIINFMEKSGYHEYAFTGINSIFVDSKAL